MTNPSTPLDVCCHTCHRDPREPCRWLESEPEEFHRMRELHFRAVCEGRITCPEHERPKVEGEDALWQARRDQSD